MAEEHGDPCYDLVMPFLAVRSKGGPYDDEAYVAGYEMGQLDALLESHHHPINTRAVQTANLAQVDLLAMQYGYTIRSTPYQDDPEWTTVEFIKD